MTGPMNPPPLTYFCSECDEESEPWEDEPLGLCRYTGRPHGGIGSNPGPCDCDASADWICEECDPPQWTTLDESYARAEAMGHGSRL